MDNIMQEQPFYGTVKFKLSSLISEMESFWVSDNIEQDLLSQANSPSQRWNLFYYPQSWKTFGMGDSHFFLPQGCLLLLKPGVALLSDSTSGKGGPSYFMEINRLSEKIQSESNLGLTRSELASLYKCFEKKSSPILDVSPDLNCLLEEINKICLISAGDCHENLEHIKLKNLFRQVLVIIAEGKAITSNALDSRIDSLLPKLPLGGYSLLIENAINQMGNDFDENITLVNLARIANISLSRFKVRFAQETGLTPLEYFTRLTIQKAMFLLHDTGKSISLISEELGYSSVGHFSSIFRNTAGLTPGEFRRGLEREKRTD